MKTTFDWNHLVDDCGGTSPALRVLDAFRKESIDLTEKVRTSMKASSPEVLGYHANRLRGALSAINAEVASELAARLVEVTELPQVSPYPIWMKLCAELGRVEVAMNGIDAWAA